MCIAIPGRIEKITGSDSLTRSAEVDFGGVRREISVALLPEAKIGDWVLAHAGVAIGLIDEDEARKTLELIQRIETVQENKNQS